MKKFLKSLAYQADKPFYVWALTLGPVWAQNITFVALWIYTALLALLVIAQIGDIQIGIERAKKDKEWGRNHLAEGGSGFWTLPSFIVVGVLAAKGWFVTSFFFGALVLISYGTALIKKEGIKEAIGEGNKVQDSTSGS